MFSYFAATAETPEIALFQYGLAGIVIAGMAYAIKILYADNKALIRENAELQAAWRVATQANSDKVIDLSNNFSQTTQLLYEKIKAAKGEG